MAATNQSIKDFFALSGNNPNVTNAQLVEVADWMKAVTSWEEGDPDPDADTLVDLLYADLRAKVTHWLRDQAVVTF
jgi:hypothetical protein